MFTPTKTPNPSKQSQHNPDPVESQLGSGDSELHLSAQIKDGIEILRPVEENVGHHGDKVSFR